MRLVVLGGAVGVLLGLWSLPQALVWQGCRNYLLVVGNAETWGLPTLGTCCLVSEHV